ncbi:MAG: hypothetical protein ACAH17_03820 [Candidatus Paceibacterota bacterium]
MDTIRYLLGFIVKLVVGIVIVVFVLWLVGLLYPNFKASNLFKGGVFSFDWLPAPKNYGGLLGTRSDTNGKVYQSGPAYNGYAQAGNQYGSGADVEWTIYTGTSSYVVKSNPGNQVFTGNTTQYAEKSLYIRNLSVYEGGNISYGMVIFGEARQTMFKNGVFTLTVIDRSGKIIAVTQAINTGTWATPGWTRFQATIPTRLPQGAECALVFYSANEPIKVGLAVRCN